MGYAQYPDRKWHHHCRSFQSQAFVKGRHFEDFIFVFEVLLISGNTSR